MADSLSDRVVGDRAVFLPPRRSPSILIVDDNPNNLLALQAVLAPLGQQLVCAPSGEDALRQLLGADFAVILLDVRMAGMDGFETAELIRRRPRSERTPIIFVTAFGEAESDIPRGYALGAVDFVFAPINPEVLRNKVSVFVDLHEKSEEVRRQGERLRVLEVMEHRRRLELAETGRRQAEARFATMLDIAGDAILAVDEQHHIVVFNRAAERTFGCTAPSVIGRPLDELVGDVANALLSADGDEHAHVRRELRARRASGEEFPAEVTVALTPYGEDNLYTVILRDVGAQREAAEHVRRLNAALDQRLRTGVDMVADLAASLDAAEVLGRFVLRAATALSADHGTLLRIDPRRMIVTASHELRDTDRYERTARIAEQPLLMRALDERLPIIASPFNETDLPAVTRAWGGIARHVAVLPLLTAGEVTAILLLARANLPFSDDDLDMLQLIGNVAVVALRNAELFGQAEESSRTKSEFLNLAAHELRTPLTVVRGYASMLYDGTFGAPPRGWERPLEVMDAKLSELNTLVDDLLAAARADAQEIAASAVSFDLREVVRAALVRAQPRADLAQAAVCAELGDRPAEVMGDPEHTGRIIDNLFNNALTYTIGPPWVRISVFEHSGELLVEDRGVGIPNADRERIFERFYRVNDPALGPRSGTGLGLYISRALAEMQGGSLRLVRSNRRGSAFALRLPRVTKRRRTRIPS